MRRVIFNLKGGVGKSTITCNLAAISAYYGKKTLVVDLDAQANSSQYLLGLDQSPYQPNISDYYRSILNLTHKNSELDKYVHPTSYDNLYLIPADSSLSKLEFELTTRKKFFKLRQLLDALTDFDVVFIDTPPAFNYFTQSALIAADRCLIPFDCDLFSRQAIYNLLDGLNKIKKEYHPHIKVEGIIVNQFQPQAKLPLKLIQELKAEKLPVMKPFLTHSIRIRESHEIAKPLIYMNSTHKNTREYIELFESMLGMLTPGLDNEAGINNSEIELSSKPKHVSKNKAINHEINRENLVEID